MDIIKKTVLKNGRIRVVVELNSSERLLSVVNDGYYSLGYPVEEVMHADIIANAQQVTWCSLEQKWLQL